MFISAPADFGFVEPQIQIAAPASVSAPAPARLRISVTSYIANYGTFFDLSTSTFFTWIDAWCAQIGLKL